MDLVAQYDLDLHRIDVKPTFLNKNLEEESYTNHPKVFSIKGNNTYNLNEGS